MVVTPEGLSDSFDARGQDRRTLYEMKTGYGWLLNANLTPAQQRFRETTLERWTRQGSHQFAVAGRCGYDLVWVLTNEAARRFADGIVPAPTRTVRFSCNEVGERGR